MDGFGTSTEEMARAGAHVLEVNGSVQAELTALRARLDPLVGLWSGDAATRFMALMARWDADARTLNEALRSIGEAVQRAGVVYQTNEDEGGRDLSAITAALG